MIKDIHDFIEKNLLIIVCVCAFVLTHRNLDFKNIDSYIIVGLLSEIAGMMIALHIIKNTRFVKIEENNNSENQ